MTAADVEALVARIDFREESALSDVSAFEPCGLVIEAIVEDFDAKKALFEALDAVVGHSCVLATNTSSLSVTALGGEAQARRRASSGCTSSIPRRSCRWSRWCRGRGRTGR